jgi:hypothetical protein
MSRAPAIFILVTTILVVGFFALDAYMTRTGKLPPDNAFSQSNSSPLSLPANALRITPGVLPDSLMLNFAAAKDDAQRRDAASLWLDHWTPDEGWLAQVEEVREEIDHIALRCWMPNPLMVGGGYLLIAKLPRDDQRLFTRRMEVRLFGRVADLQHEVLGGLPQYRLVLDEASVLP